ncbi:cupin domain-containing protein [Mucilaginibacter jinjuensis]|uniref:Cupin domain-containing protein n=1 Tax=Mucilaginibacter jinjuensis TaxID=1176721 RepID=A0ABY7TCV8_9SPHI|nr:cupin domain-containing protein [Mucilaginibacter jinjuensis]WCT13900.1 cupin domain-containing protein [Mucilaginibacter jinjuensis]
MDTHTSVYWIKHLDFQPHPEGGFYKEVFRSGITVNRGPLLKQACTSIYYLLEGKDYSGFHRLASDEIWYFHKGTPLCIHVINEAGDYYSYELSDTNTGNLSVVIEAGLWFAAEIPLGESFTLVSCAVAPGFEFAEFEMAEVDTMRMLYPQHSGLLERLCRK